MRAWFNGRMEASQALDEGSIPFARFLIRNHYGKRKFRFGHKTCRK